MSSCPFEDLKARGFIYQNTSEEAIKQLLAEGPVYFYAGFDPTGDSLHVGHLLPVMAMRRLQQAGHKPIVLVGGATGQIGDPSGKSEARVILSKEVVAHNAECLRDQLSRFISPDDAVFANNAEWFSNMLYLDFLRDIGSKFSVNKMLTAESVKMRLEKGLSFLEFNYMILQAYDFYMLNRKYNCRLEIGGQDQWGNITAGIELVRKKLGKEVYGFTMPLLTKSDGSKFGKTNGKAIWLDINKTSAYEMYQFFINSEDSKVIDYLKFLTFLSKEEIERLEASNREHPELREAHKALAKEVITFLHGQEAYDSAVKIAETFFKGSLKDLTYDELKQGTADLERTRIEDGAPLINTLVSIGACKSNREARDLISGSSISINGEKVNDLNFVLKKDDAFNNELTIIKKGKKYYYAVEF